MRIIIYVAEHCRIKDIYDETLSNISPHFTKIVSHCINDRARIDTDFFSILVFHVDNLHMNRGYRADLLLIDEFVPTKRVLNELITHVTSPHKGYHMYYHDFNNYTKYGLRKYSQISENFRYDYARMENKLERDIIKQGVF